MMLPDDVINEIMYYGDVNVTLKYIGVINQLNYYKKEFDYQRKNHKNGYWYGLSNHDYKLYVLYKSKDKYDMEIPYRLVMNLTIARSSNVWFPNFFRINDE